MYCIWYETITDKYYVIVIVIFFKLMNYFEFFELIAGEWNSVLVARVTYESGIWRTSPTAKACLS